MADRRVRVVFSAEIQGFKQAMAAAATATEKAKRASEESGKAADKSAEEIARQALAHHEAAKAAGLQYSNTGQLVTMNGKALTSQQAATHGLQTFSEEAYLAGRAAVTAGEEADAAARLAADAQAVAAEAAKEHKSALEELGIASAVGGAAVVAGVGMAVKAYADFDKAMSSVDAATHETAGNMELLRQAAIDAGADTAFSAGEAAQGIEELAKAGVSTKDILAGGLNGSLALAAAGSLDVGAAAEIAASALTQFGLEGDQVMHVADLLAAGAGKAQGSVEDLGAALNQSGLVAASTGLTIEETTGALAAFASAGLTGSDAGTSFKTMLMSLNPNSEAASKLMDSLGLSAYDAQGKFIGMSEYAGVLQNALKDMSDEQRNATLKTLFGTDAVRAANIMYEQGEDGINKWEKAVNQAGFAADTASRMQNNLAGDLEKLGGSFDTVLIQSGSGANDVLRSMVQGLEGLVDAVGKVPGPLLATGAGIAGVVGGAALLAGGLVSGIARVNDLRAAFNTVAPAGTRARGAIMSVGKVALGLAAIGTAAIVLAKIAESDYLSKIDTGMGNVNNALVDLTRSAPGAANALDVLFKDRDGGELINTVDSLESAIERTFNRDAGQQFNDWGEGLMNSMTGVKGSSQILGESFKRLDAGLADMVSSGNREGAVKSFEKIREAAKNQGVSVEELVKKFPGYSDALKQADADGKKAADGADAAAKGIDGAGTAAEVAKASAEDMAKALEDVGLAADGSVEDIDKFAKSLFNAGLLSLSASDASIGYQAAIDAMTESVKANGTTLDINTEKGRANQSAFNGLAQAAMTSAEATATETLATQGSAAAQAQLQTSLKTSYDDLVRAAGQLGITGDAADTMARKALGIPKEIPIDTWVKDNATATLDAIKGKADNLDGKKVTVEIFEKTWATRYNNGTMDVNNVANGPGGAGGTTEYATGGRLPGYADGGQLPTSGPGTGMTDGFLGISSAGIPMARVDAGEWIINRGSSGRYNRELAAINAGTFPKLPGYASGGRSREYSAQSLGVSPVNVAAAPVYVQNPFTGDYLLARAATVAAGVVASADSQSQFSRRGR
jgi:TP901 family phage tail tape measure protein